MGGKQGCRINLVQGARNFEESRRLCQQHARNLCLSRQVHGLIFKYGFSGNVILESSIVDVYGKCGAMVDARRMFDEIEFPNDVSWNVIVRRYLEMGQGSEAIKMFAKMLRLNVKPMSFTVSNAILACSSIGGLREGFQIHGFSVKINAEEDEVVSNTLIDMYAKCGDLESVKMVFKLQSSKNVISYTSMVSAFTMSGRMAEARKLFDEMPERTVVSWNVMLAGYTRASDWEKALEFLILMRRSTRDADRVTLGLFVSICAAIPDMDLAKQSSSGKEKLVVEVVAAHNLMPKDGEGSSSPFVEVEFENQRQRRTS